MWFFFVLAIVLISVSSFFFSLSMKSVIHKNKKKTLYCFKWTCYKSSFLFLYISKPLIDLHW